MSDMNDSSEANTTTEQEPRKGHTLFDWLRGPRKLKNGEATVRETLEELIEETDEGEAPIDEDQRTLLTNILRLRDRTVDDVMVPRVDIISVEESQTYTEIAKTLVEEGHSRAPIYRDSLDDIIGMVHIRDLLGADGESKDFKVSLIARKLLFVSPSMRVLELLLEMRTTRIHMALVVDEYGGTDGLVTIEDLVEEIVGEIEDEHDHEKEPELVRMEDGQVEADARVTVEIFEEFFGQVLNPEERDEIDTLGGLVFTLAGRVPLRGELITHPSGIEFEILEADPRLVYRLRIRMNSQPPHSQEEANQKTPAKG